MQPLQSKQIVAFALGLVVLGILTWVLVKSLVPSQTPAVAFEAAPAAAITQIENSMPNKVVTMLGVPEVIVSPPGASGAESGLPDSKPSKRSRDTEEKSSPLPPAHLNAGATPAMSAPNPVSTAARRSDDSWLVKPK